MRIFKLIISSKPRFDYTNSEFCAIFFCVEAFLRRLKKIIAKTLVKLFALCYNINLFGGVAHLGERDIRIVEVTGSSPAVSTTQKSTLLSEWTKECFFV